MSDSADKPQCPRVLIVEDDIDQQALMLDALRMYFGDDAGDRIQAAGSAAECLRHDLTATDIVLLDYNLPDAAGLDLLKEILTRADLPVIFVTGENVAETAAQAIQAGAYDYLVKLGDYLFAIPVLIEKNLRQHQIRLENQRLLEEIQVKNRQLQEALARQEKMAATDHLTNLANRRHFGEMLEKYFSEAQRYDYDLSCIMMDLDNYKTLNDTLGHQMGDKILVTASQVIQANLRSSDLAARYGGDEFVCLLPHTSVDLARQVADRIREQMTAASSQYLKIGRGLTMSVGIASVHNSHPPSADKLVAQADKALYESKENGRNRVTIFRSEPISQ